jgi:hypothetical protein
MTYSQHSLAYCLLINPWGHLRAELAPDAGLDKERDL